MPVVFLLVGNRRHRPSIPHNPVILRTNLIAVTGSTAQSPSHTKQPYENITREVNRTLVSMMLLPSATLTMQR